MSWLNRLANVLLSSAEPAVRPAESPILGHVEPLEDRLSLGSMAIPQAAGAAEVLPEDTSPHVIDPTLDVSLEPAGRQSQNPISSVAWFDQQADPVEIRYDFRSQDGFENAITAEQQQLAKQALQAWTAASNGRIRWVRDTSAAAEQIVNIGVGDLSAFGMNSRPGGTLGVAGSSIERTPGDYRVVGTIWLDRAETWDHQIGNGNPPATVDFLTVMAHEAGHVIGLDDIQRPQAEDIMNSVYDGERPITAIHQGLQNAVFFPASGTETSGAEGHSVHGMMMGFPQLEQSEVETLLKRAAAASSTEDAIIAVVDRNGRILGVRVEQDVLDTIADPATLVFAIDGAVAKARTAAFFANGEANEHSTALTSRLVRFVSQSTVTQREVESNPNVTDTDSPLRGPGFVAPIGLGGHFPPEIDHTPPVDLFGIEHTNRDSLTHPGPDLIKGTGDDIPLTERFNIDAAFVPAGQKLEAPISYGEDSGILPEAQSRGIATLPGGIPLFRDTTLDGNGDTLVGGIGVFFPGPDGFATHEQGFIPGANQTEFERTNAARVLESEFIAVVAAGGSVRAEALGARGAKVGAIHGIAPVGGLDIPFGNLSLVGINLQVVGPTAGIEGVKELIRFASTNLTPGDPNSGANQVLGGGVFLRDGASVPEGVLVTPHDSAVDDLSAGDVQQIIDTAVQAANRTRAAVRLEEFDFSPGARTRMVFAITDTTGEVLGLFRMKDATVFSIDVAVAKARNVAYYADAATLQPEDQIAGVPAGTAFTNRTFRFVAEPRFPDGVDGTPPPPFSILNNPSIDPATGENLAAPAPASSFTSVLGFDAFNPGANFRDPDDIANQNGIVFFPGSTPIYKNGVLVGGLGVSGDGVDQDDVVTFLAAQGFLPDGVAVGRADQTRVSSVRLPYIKFLRNPFG